MTQRFSSISLPSPAMLALLAIAGCSGINMPLTDKPNYGRDEHMFAAGYEDIDRVYIQKPDIGYLTMGGLSALAAMDQKLSVARDPDKIDLVYAGKIQASFVVTNGFEVDDWAALTAKAVENARKLSPAIGKADSEAIYKAVFDGVTGRLDSFSHYVGRQQAKEDRAWLEGFGGIGVAISVESGVVRVVSVMHDTPAERATMRAGDLITAIDGTPTKTMDERTVVEKLRGPVGSHVALTVARVGTPAALGMIITRIQVIPDMVSYRREGDIAYFRIYGFNQDTADSLRRAFRGARNEIGAHMRGVVLDLRGNPGGLLDQAITISGLFLDHGRIVSTNGREPGTQQHFDATPGDISKGLPIAVLVNGGSASASEIVAAALQDNGRAVVIGSNSYGKGTVQTVLPMPNDGELRLTIARFYPPSGYTLNHLGVLPTICTDNEGEDANKLLDDLSEGRIAAVPVIQRDTVSPDNTPARDKLRARCPVYKGERAIDLKIALGLVAQPLLYSRAVALAEPAAGLPAAQAALNQSSSRP